MSNFLTKAFGFDPQKNTVRTELVAGLTTFLTMAYILAVNPNIFSALPGMPAGSVFTATALAAIIATLVMAFWAKKPFALAPGMGLNAFFVFTVCLTMGHTWQFALTAVLIEGLIFVVLTLTKVRTWILNAIPLSLKHAIGAGIGLFIAFIGLQNAGLIVNNDATLVSLGDVCHGTGLLAVIGLVISCTLVMLHVSACSSRIRPRVRPSRTSRVSCRCPTASLRSLSSSSGVKSSPGTCWPSCSPSCSSICSIRWAR